MADSFHFNISIISRGKGKSAVASAAYISGERIKNEWDGEITQIIEIHYNFIGNNIELEIAYNL